MHPLNCAIVAARHRVSGTTWNPSDKGTGITLSNGNLTATTTNAGSWSSCRAVASDNSGLRYMEIKLVAVDGTTGGLMLGIGSSSAAINSFCGVDANGWSWQMTVTSSAKYHSNVNAGYGATAVVNDVIGMLFNFSTSTLTFYKNGVSQGSAFTNVTAGTYFPMVSIYESTVTVTANFGSSSWQFPPGVGETQW